MSIVNSYISTLSAYKNTINTFWIGYSRRGFSNSCHCWTNSKYFPLPFAVMELIIRVQCVGNMIRNYMVRWSIQYAYLTLLYIPDLQHFIIYIIIHIIAYKWWLYEYWLVLLVPYFSIINCVHWAKLKHDNLLR